MSSLKRKDGGQISSLDGGSRAGGNELAAMSSEAIQAWLVSQVAAILKLDPAQIDPRKAFTFYGLDSIDAVGLSNDLEELLGRTLPPTLAWDSPTIESLANWLAKGESSLETSRQVEQTRAAAHEAIAIIGIGCRFPGGVVDPKSFWELLRNGVDAITEVPNDRWNAEAFYDPRPGIRGKTNTRWGGFLDRIDEFDPLFFGITTREACSVDPQQRLLLEVAWEALEDAGLRPQDLARTRTGVFVGISTNDYWNRLQSDLGNMDAYMTPGGAISITANRISYFFDFCGPSIVVDTACSSSLVAIDLACRSILSGQSNLALAGGANLLLSPAVAISFSQGMATSPDGHCKAFDAGANGMVRSEGVGLVVLKPLNRALADGDPIYALILGSAVNQDGRTNGIAAPNQSSQEAVLREAYQTAGVSPGKIQYVDAHGTGTLLGDPIEAKALGKVLADGRSPGSLCGIGSVKSNLGHLEAAAGIASVIKVALALKHKEIPPSIHFHKPNPHIPFDELPLYVQQTLGPWPIPSDTALAGVSGFGFGGTNAHVVLQEFVSEPAVRPSVEESADELMLLTLSAHSPAALDALAGKYATLLEGNEKADGIWLRDICYTASARRTHHDYRLALIARSSEDFLDLLRGFIGRESKTNSWFGQQTASRQAKLVFVFSGQGVSLTGVGRELYDEEPAFRAAIEECEEIIKAQSGHSVKQILLSTATNPEESGTDLTQLALFAMQVSLAKLWQHWGISPAAVIGHSVGELAAAHVAGVLSLVDAVRVVSARGSLMQQEVERDGLPGAMVAVKLGIEEAERALSGYEDRLSVAVHNSRSAVVLSGEAAALKEVVESLQKEKVSVRWLPVPGAGHSPQAEPLRWELSKALEGLRPENSRVPIFSTVTGGQQDGNTFDADYWGRNLRDTVRFADAIEATITEGYDTFLEIGPHPLLTAAASQSLNHHRRKGLVLGSLRRGEDHRKSLLGTLAALYARGCAIDWKKLYNKSERPVSLPSYPWQRNRFWLNEGRKSQGGNSEASYSQDAGGITSVHPLLQKHLRSSLELDTHFWETEIGLSSLSYLRDHRVEETALLPAAAYLEMALSAAVQSYGPGPYAIEEVSIERALPLLAETSSTLQLILRREMSERVSFKFFSTTQSTVGESARWVLHAAGTMRREATPQTSINERSIPEVVRARCPEIIAGADFYRMLADHGGQYGPSFQNVEQIWRRSGEALGQVQMAETLAPEADLYQIHPALLDACFQTLAAAFPQSDGHHSLSNPFLPVGLKLFRLFSHPQASKKFFCHARIESNPDGDERLIEGDVVLFDETGRVVFEALGLRAQALSQTLSPAVDDWFYEIDWESSPNPLNSNTVVEVEDPLRSWLIFTDRQGVGQEVEALLTARGATCVIVEPGEEYLCSTTERYRVNPSRPQDFQRLFEEAFAQRHRSCVGVVHLWGVEAAGNEPCSLSLLEQVRDLGCNSLLHTVQALVAEGSSHAPRLWVVTRGANSLKPGIDPPSVVQTPVLGLVKAIALEHPEFHCTSVDLSAGSLPEEIKILVEELSLNQLENQISLRGTERFVARLRRRSLRPELRGSRGAVASSAQQWSLLSEAAQGDSFRLRVVEDGSDYDLSFPARALRRPGRDEVEIQVRACGLSVGDISKLRESSSNGLEKEIELVHGCAGRIVDVGDGDHSFAIGDEVIALVSSRPGVFVTASKRCVIAKPPGLSFEDAASIPMAFLTDGLAQGVLTFLSAKVFTDGNTASVLDISQSPATRRIIVSFQTNTDGTGNISGRPVTFRSDGTYLIAGGLGGLGITVAGWMVAHGARYLVLLGRRQASPAVEEILARLRAAGAQIRIAQADVSQPSDVGRVMREIKASMPRLRGIIHSASVLDDGILINQTAERFKTVWEPKVSGVWNLHEQTSEEELDFFIMFSSAASVLGSPGQSNYVTANTFLDGLAHYRRAKGLPGLSINWGPWSEVGGAAVIGSKERLAARGAESIRPSQGVEALGQVLASDAIQIAVMPFDLRQWCKFYPKAAESSSLLIGLLSKQNESVSHAQRSTMRRMLLAAKPDQRERLLQTHLQQQIAEVLGFPPEQIGIHVSLGDLGFDSLVAVDVKGRLEASLELTLSPTLIWNYPTVAELARYLLEQMEMPVKARETSDSEPDIQRATNLDQLSQDELAALLEREIAHAAERNPS